MVLTVILTNYMFEISPIRLTILNTNVGDFGRNLWIVTGIFETLSQMLEISTETFEIEIEMLDTLIKIIKMLNKICELWTKMIEILTKMLEILIEYFFNFRPKYQRFPP